MQCQTVQLDRPRTSRIELRAISRAHTVSDLNVSLDATTPEGRAVNLGEIQSDGSLACCDELGALLSPLGVAFSQSHSARVAAETARTRAESAQRAAEAQTQQAQSAAA